MNFISEFNLMLRNVLDLVIPCLPFCFFVSLTAGTFYGLFQFYRQVKEANEKK